MRCEPCSVFRYGGQEKGDGGADAAEPAGHVSDGAVMAAEDGGEGEGVQGWPLHPNCRKVLEKDELVCLNSF